MTDYATTTLPTYHQTLAGTAADKVQIGDMAQGRRYGALEVYNRSLTDDLWFTYAVNDTQPTTAVAGAIGTYYVPPDSSLAVSLATDRTPEFTVSLIGNNNPYSVHGLPV